MKNILSQYEEFNNDSRVYLAGDIPLKKARNAIKSYADTVSINEILLLVDDTVWGSAKNGLIITEKAILGRSLGDDSRLLWFNIIEDIFAVGERIHANGSEFLHMPLPESETLVAICDAVKKRVGINETKDVVPETEEPASIDQEIIALLTINAGRFWFKDVLSSLEQISDLSILNFVVEVCEVGIASLDKLTQLLGIQKEVAGLIIVNEEVMFEIFVFVISRFHFVITSQLGRKASIAIMDPFFEYIFIPYAMHRENRLFSNETISQSSTMKRVSSRMRIYGEAENPLSFVIYHIDDLFIKEGVEIRAAYELVLRDNIEEFLSQRYGNIDVELFNLLKKNL